MKNLTSPQAKIVHKEIEAKENINQESKSRIKLRGQWGSGHVKIAIFEKCFFLISKDSLYKAIFMTFWKLYA